MEKGLTKNQILSELSRSPHGKLNEYLPVGLDAAKQHAEFFAHLVCWNHLKGQVRDSKVALPVVSLACENFPAELVENSLAHLALLGPRELLKAYRFALEVKLPKRMRAMRRLVEAYLRDREANVGKWDRVAIQHRHTLKELYSLVHLKPSERANIVLYGRDHAKRKCPLPTGSLFEVVARLKDMSPVEAAGAIITLKLPFLVALGALGVKAKEPDLVLALIGRMTPTDLVTNTKMLERLGVKTNPALRGAYEKALEGAAKSKKNLLKTTRAAEEIEDEGLKEKLRGLQERQIQTLSGVEGNWLVLGDKSGSMAQSIEVSREVAATLAKMVKGKVWLVFFDTSPQTVDVTGMALDAIKAATRFIRSGGGTSIGCGLVRMLESKEEIDGIAIVSDGGDNTVPFFHEAYRKYAEWSGKEVPVYFYRCQGSDPPGIIKFMEGAGIDLQVFDLTQGTDYYALPDLASTMRTNRYSLIDEIMATRLLKLADVLKVPAAQAVNA